VILAGTNYDTNPSVEDVSNPFSPTSCTLTLSTASPYVGVQCLLIAPTSAGVSARATRSVLAVTVGEEVNISARVAAQQINGRARINILYYTTSGASVQVGSTIFGTWTALTLEEYIEVQVVNSVVPATATYMKYQLEVDTTTGVLTSNRFRADAFVVRRNEALDTYIDGNQGDGYSWLGTPHASISTRAADAGVVYRRDYEAPQVIVSWTAWQCDMDGVRENEITEYLISGFVETKGDRLIPAQGQIKLTDARLLNPLTDYVDLEMTVALPPTMESESYKMGLYQVSIPSLTAYWERPEGTFTLRDRTVELAETLLTDAVTYAVGANAVTSASSLASTNGLACNFPTVSTTLPVAMSFSVGDQVMESVNKLLDVANCYPAWMDFEHNVLVTLPIRDLNTLTPWQSLTPDMLLAEPELKPVNVMIPNVVLVIKENSEEAPIVGTARNDNPASPISTYGRGREIVHVVKDSAVATILQANTLAGKILQEMEALEVSLDLVLIPAQPPTVHDSLSMSYHNNDYCLCGRYWINGFRYEILGSSAMKVEIRRTKEITHS
jgi:hypothetical protein